MSAKTGSKDLEAVLDRLKNEWEQLATLLKSQGQPQERVIEVEELLLRDAAGVRRGQLSAPADGSVGLLLRDQEGHIRAWLGINSEGEAGLELRDQKGEVSFKASVTPASPDAGVGPAANPPGDQPPPPAGAAAPGGSAPEPPAPAPEPAEPPGGEAPNLITARLEHVERQLRRQRFFRGLILVVLGVVLGTQAFLLFRYYLPGPVEVQGLVVRPQAGGPRVFLGGADQKLGLELWDRQGKRRAILGLGPEGAPGLTLYDQNQQARAELHLGPEGEPQFVLGGLPSPPAPSEPKAPTDSGTPQAPGSTGAGPEAGTTDSPAAGQAAVPEPPAEVAAPVPPAEAASPAPPVEVASPVAPPEAESEVEFVGSKTSNKYHYPTCKWVKWIHPSKLIKFKSPAEAEEHRYTPCPLCKPPRSR